MMGEPQESHTLSPSFKFRGLLKVHIWSKGTPKSPVSHAPGSDWFLHSELIICFHSAVHTQGIQLLRRLPVLISLMTPWTWDTLPLELCMYGDFANIFTKILYEGIWFTSDFFKKFTTLCANARSHLSPRMLHFLEITWVNILTGTFIILFSG